MENKTQEVIKQSIENLLEKMGFSGTVTITESGEDDSVICNITTGADSHFLIGQHGVNLQAIQHLSRLMVRKQIPDKIRFVLDVNDYRQQKNQTIIQQALQAAEEAVTHGRSVSMKPMSTYERRIAHMELSKDSRVSTESVGEGEERKIVIKPANLID